MASPLVKQATNANVQIDFVNNLLDPFLFNDLYPSFINIVAKTTTAFNYALSGATESRVISIYAYRSF